MADVITLKDGSVEIIFEPKDFQYLVEKHLGYDAETYFRTLIEKLQKEVKDALDKEQSDLGAYEASLESNTRAFIDIEEICRSMIEDFNKEQGRNRLAALRPWRNKVEEILKIINNQI